MTRPDPADLPQIVVGHRYPFYCEMQQEYLPPEERMRRFTGQDVKVVAALGAPDEMGSPQFTVRTDDDSEFTAQEEELNGWDLALGQYFWPDATYGPNHDTTFLVNERS